MLKSTTARLLSKILFPMRRIIIWLPPYTVARTIRTPQRLFLQSLKRVSKMLIITLIKVMLPFSRRIMRPLLRALSKVYF